MFPDQAVGWKESGVISRITSASLSDATEVAETTMRQNWNLFIIGMVVNKDCVRCPAVLFEWWYLIAFDGMNSKLRGPRQLIFSIICPGSSSFPP